VAGRWSSSDDTIHVRVPLEVPVQPVAPEPVADEPDLDDRKLRILRAIVAEYVANGEPVGSKRVVEAARLDVSAATVRNEMAALEELGYIRQPHTSAGRVPTDKGYRRFVDDLAASGAIDGPRRELVGELLGSARDVEELLARTSSVLTQLTRLVSLVIAPAMDASRCKLVELVGPDPERGAAAARGRHRPRREAHGRAAGRDDRARPRPHPDRPRRAGPRPGAARRPPPAALARRRGARRAARGARGLAEATATDLTDETLHHVFVGGQASLAGEESFERDQLSRVLQLLEERVTLARLLSETTADDEPTVRIGGENEVEDLRSTSLVAQRYRLVTAGSLGVLGPTRMDYATVLATVRAVADQLQASLTDLSR
jgi:heat-inducible transcriptional repressor